MRNLNDSFLSLNNHNWFLNNSVNNYVSDLNVVINLFGSDDLNFFDNFLYYLLDLHDLRYSNYLLDNLFNINWHLYYFFDYLLDSDNFFLIDHYFSNLSLDMVNDFSDSDWFFNFNYFLDNSVDSVHFRNFSNDFDYPVLDSGDFYCFLDDFLN